MTRNWEADDPLCQPTWLLGAIPETGPCNWRDRFWEMCKPVFSSGAGSSVHSCGPVADCVGSIGKPF